MMLGKVKQALKFVDTNNDVAGVHELTDDIKTKLEAKHPEGEPMNLMDMTSTVLTVPVEEVIFEDINAE